MVLARDLEMALLYDPSMLDLTVSSVEVVDMVQFSSLVCEEV